MAEGNVNDTQQPLEKTEQIYEERRYGSIQNRQFLDFQLFLTHRRKLHDEIDNFPLKDRVVHSHENRQFHKFHHPFLENYHFYQKKDNTRGNYGRKRWLTS